MSLVTRSQIQPVNPTSSTEPKDQQHDLQTAPAGLDGHSAVDERVPDDKHAEKV